jgi:hypothetical protein
VREWGFAQRGSGEIGRQATMKLATHFIAVGRKLFDESAKPTADESCLDNALRAFQRALEYDGANAEAGDLYRETKTQIDKREVERQFAMQLVGTAQTVLKTAEQKRLAKDYASAITTYSQASVLFDQVDAQFPDQKKAAGEGAETARKSIRDIENEVLDGAQSAITRGDSAVTNSRFEDAFAAYKSVDSILGVISSDKSTTQGKHKEELLDAANQKMEEAKNLKKRYDEEQLQKEQAIATQR